MDLLLLKRLTRALVGEVMGEVTKLPTSWKVGILRLGKGLGKVGNFRGAFKVFSAVAVAVAVAFHVVSHVRWYVLWIRVLH